MDILAERFGGTTYYADSFINSNSQLAKSTLTTMEATKSGSDKRYEEGRQKFLMMYGMHRGRWHSTSPATDRYVTVSRIAQTYTSAGLEYLAFMRVQPNGFRGERSVPSHMKLDLHLLMGKVGMTYRKRLRHMKRGDHIHIASNSTFALKCLSSEQEALFVFRIILKK